ncbi:MAG: LCP family protein, partial [Clostridia bacterium]|nr:LCP family protein [Clostridia bacterium]
TRLNSAYSVGGVDLLKQTVEANLGITVDKYIIVDFTAFKTVVNKIGKLNGKGGIKITVTSAEANYMCHHEKYGLFPRFEKGKGTYYMNGAEALNYARIRKIDSDFGRTKRQRKVLTEIMNELKGLGYMDLISIGYACLEYVTTDFTKAELVGLASEAPAVMNYGNAQISIPVKGSYTTQHMSNGNEVLAANLSVNAQILGDFIYNDDMKYEGNNKEVRGIYLPDLKGIANSNVTTKHDTESTTSAEPAGTTATQTGQTTKKAAKSTKSTKSTQAAKTTAKKTTSSAANTTTTTATTAVVAVG